MRWRIAVSVAIGLASGVFCWFLLKHFHQEAGDFRWAIYAARRLLAGENPYDTPLEQYPVTAALFAILCRAICRTAGRPLPPQLSGHEFSRRASPLSRPEEAKN